MLAFGLSIVTAAVGITLWSISTFESKASASQYRVTLERRVDGLEKEVNTIRETLGRVAIDVSYIRGRMEPATK